MGNLLHVGVPHVEKDAQQSRKRKFIEGEEEIEEKFSPSRKKLQTTSEYIYKTLYINGENSDITIDALGKSWNLHKVYLCQSLYFKSMFKGDWSEKNLTVIKLTFPDSFITSKALDIVFGSMYRYEVDVEVLIANLIPVIAAARMFDLGGLLKHCEDTVLETINAENVCIYYDASQRYGLTEVSKKCFSWLERNMLLCKTLTLAKYLTKELLINLLQSPNLAVMQVEMDIYNFLKIWLYFQMCNDHSEISCPKNLIIDTQKYFQCMQKKTKTCFLSSEEGLQYADVFKCLRFENMLGDAKCILLLEKDAIVPQNWLLPVYQSQWKSMLSVYNGEDTGPKQIVEDLFYKQACRCGRILETDTRYCWRWTGLFSFGIDIILIYNNRTKILSVKRNTYSQPCNFAVCLQSQRAVVLRLKAFTIKINGEELKALDTGILLWNFHTDEELPLLTLDDTWTFPVFVSTRFLLSNSS
ncbi:germ cell-less protein-like 1 isoform X2 [Hydra vulgaris]|uniref:Germ cell-less protein-like 1 isoform X2 n=2 Tax=Hydra vulgaris TaxID=6087 RepID=A0ABM4D8R5_HYDVU